MDLHKRRGRYRIREGAEVTIKEQVQAHLDATAATQSFSAFLADCQTLAENPEEAQALADALHRFAGLPSSCREYLDCVFAATGQWCNGSPFGERQEITQRHLDFIFNQERRRDGKPTRATGTLAAYRRQILAALPECRFIPGLDSLHPSKPLPLRRDLRALTPNQLARYRRFRRIFKHARALELTLKGTTKK